MFFISLFNELMRKRPSDKDLEVAIFYDEFGHSTIPDFNTISNTIRKYKVPMSLVWQGRSQLDSKYGISEAKDILTGIGTHMVLSGADLETTNYFAEIIGMVRERQESGMINTRSSYQEFKLISASEIRTLANNEALLVVKNINPIKLHLKPFFDSYIFKSYSMLGSVPLEEKEYFKEFELKFEEKKEEV